MTNKEITKVIFNNSEISALYYGDVLIWKKEKIGNYNFSGAFTNDVTGSNNTVKATFEDGTTETITIPYNSAINEFNYTFEKPLQKMELNNKEIYRMIYHFPDVSNCTDMSWLFAYCSNLTSLNVSNFDTSNCTNMYQTFYYCENLYSLDLSSFDVSKVSNMSCFLTNCAKLSTLSLGNFDVSNCTDMNSSFYYCTSLANVTGVFEGTKVDLDLGSSPLTNDSVMVFINGLANVSSTKTLSLKSSTYNTLTPEQIAVATSKGWTVISA